MIAALALSVLSPAPSRAAVESSVQQVYRPGPLTEPSTPVDGYTGELLALQAVDIGTTASEPTIGVASDGTAYFAGSILDVDNSRAWGVAQTQTMRSTDGGLTWEMVQLRVPAAEVSIPPGNLDPLIYLDPATDRIFDVSLYGACSWANYSDDKGESWSSSPATCGVLVNDHQTIGAAPPRPGHTTQGYPNVLFYCVNQVVQTGCGRSDDGGVVWTPLPEPPFPNGHDCAGLTGHLEADPDGRVFLPAGGCAKPSVAISEDSGDSWTTVAVSSIPSTVAHTSVAADSAGNLYYVWMTTLQNPLRRLPMLTVSTDHGTTWSDPVNVAPPGVNFANFPVIAAGDPGRIAINFPGSEAERTGTRSTTWNQYVVVSETALDADPIFLSATANDPADPFHRGDCIGRCGGMWDFIDVQISSAGQAWAASSDDCTGDCVAGTLQADHVGRGIAIRQIAGPPLRIT